MTSAYKEHAFEDELCAYLEAHGWLYSTNDSGYDKALALYPDDLFAWLEDTQPDELAKVVKAGTPSEAKQRTQLLTQLRTMLDKAHDQGGGTVNMLRKGFRHISAPFRLAEFRPETSLNPTTVEHYSKMRLRVVRQVRYSKTNSNSLDLVLFANGLPVATLELKTDFTQTIDDAVHQYRHDRDPGKGPTREPLLTPISGALVHFAVSDSEVRMTTKLAGITTRFLPFNLGHDGGAGNPLNPSGPQTAYLWEQVLDRDTWLDIIGKFVFVITETNIDPISGKRTNSTSIRFPRLHQWDVVTKLVETTRVEGAGQRYLVEHSAGSGKTGSIAWSAHRLSKLHDVDNKPLFDSVIVITDRTVLDDQLQQAIRQIEPRAGYIVTIDDKAIRDSGKTSKSEVLADALLNGTRIIVVTIQTFPFAMDEIRKNKGLAGKRFAVIADEAHSSQTGQTASKLRAVLTAAEEKELEDGGEIDVEMVLAAETAARAESSNISYYAFTATPKAKTLELFGQPDPTTGLPVPFHRYTMRQAIEEGYILDVLRGYQTYGTAFRIAQTADDDDLVDQAEASRTLLRWVALHPTNIDQRIKIVVEHFHEKVAHLLDGHAKAMVVTDSRKAALRYKQSIDKYLAAHHPQYKALVAFSGTVDDDDPNDKFASGVSGATETSANPDLRNRTLPAAFATDEFRIMLVANKFQTGFDQPLLSAMYVFKRLDGVAAVQTLSRLNRTYTTPDGLVKDQTMVLDFVNKAEDIRAAFEPYYTGASLEVETDPNLVNTLAAKLDQAGFYDDTDIGTTAKAWVKGGKGAHAALIAAMTPTRQRFVAAHHAAVAADDKAELDRLDTFRKDVGTFVRVYDFISQVINYGPEMEKRATFYRLLERLIRSDKVDDDTIDLSDVTLRAIKQIDRGAQDITLTGEGAGLAGITDAGSRGKKDPKLVAMWAVIDRLNDLFSTLR